MREYTMCPSYKQLQNGPVKEQNSQNGYKAELITPASQKERKGRWAGYLNQHSAHMNERLGGKDSKKDFVIGNKMWSLRAICSVLMSAIVSPWLTLSVTVLLQ